MCGAIDRAANIENLSAARRVDAIARQADVAGGAIRVAGEQQAGARYWDVVSRSACPLVVWDAFSGVTTSSNAHGHVGTCIPVSVVGLGPTAKVEMIRNLSSAGCRDGPFAVVWGTKRSWRSSQHVHGGAASVSMPYCWIA